MAKKQKCAAPREDPNLTPEERNMIIVFEFAYFLENMPGKSGLPGATAILRMFLAQRNEK